MTCSPKALLLKMLRAFLIFFSCLIWLNGQDLYSNFGNSQIGELSADSLERKGDVLYAKGNVVLVNGDFYIASNELIYHQKTQVADVSGDVKVYKGEELVLSAKNAKLDFKDKKFSLNSLYLQNAKSGLWVNASEANTDQDMYYFKKNIVSGCDIQSPIWHLDSSSGSFNQKTNVLSLWNSRVYIGGVPLLYIPYLSLSTYNQRKTGFLYPDFAYLRRDGIYYYQPLFIAPQEFWDMTLGAQIRTSRGVGGDIELRFATPQNNLFFFQAKYFYNFNKYTQRYGLKNQHVYGGSLKYQNDFVFDKLNSNIDDGFYADLNYMNDIDYLRIDSVEKKVANRFATSELNYFLQSQDHYMGIYSKYYFDLTKASNDDTLQNLPNLQYHKYLNPFYWKNLLYSIDAQSTNIVRFKGYSYVENTLSMPFAITLPLFNDFLSISASTNFDLTNIVFTQTENILSHLPNKPKSANVFTANYNASIQSDLAKDYQKFLHTMQFMAAFSGPYYRYSTDLFSQAAYKFYDKHSVQSKQEIYNVWNPSSIVPYEQGKQKLDLSFTQYFYTPSGRELVYYMISQRMFLDDPKYLFDGNPLKNDFKISPIDGLSFTGSVYYSFFYQALSSASAGMSFSKWTFSADTSYYFARTLAIIDGKKYISSNADSTSFLNFSLKNNFGYFTLQGGMSFDIAKKSVKDWSIAISKDVRCFGITLKFAQEFVSILTDNPSRPIETERNQYVKLEFRFVPLTSTGLTYRFK